MVTTRQHGVGTTGGIGVEILDLDSRILALAFARMADSIGNSFLIVVLPLYITSGVVGVRRSG